MHPQREFYTVIDLDMVGSGSRTSGQRQRMCDDLERIVSRILAQQGIALSPIEQEDTGDGMRLLFAPKYPADLILRRFIDDLDAALREHRLQASDTIRIRLRVAAHHGPIYRNARRWEGDALVLVARLLDATPLRRAIADHPEADLALIVSTDIYRDVIHDGYGPRREAFQLVEVENKELHTQAWVYVPGVMPPQLPAISQPHDAASSSITQIPDRVAARAEPGVAVSNTPAGTQRLADAASNPVAAVRNPAAVMPDSVTAVSDPAVVTPDEPAGAGRGWRWRKLVNVAVATLIVTAVAAVIPVFIPEVRCFLGLDHCSASSSSTDPGASASPTNFAAVASGRTLMLGCLDMHVGPHAADQDLACIPYNAEVAIKCTKHGQTISDGPYRTPTDIWDFVTYNNESGYVTDAWMYTGQSEAIAPQC